MTPYYQDEWSTIYHGDAVDVLPGLSADVILTDPPYGVGVEYDGYEDTPAALDALLAAAVPLMVEAAPVVALTPGIGNWWRYPAPTWVLCWYQANAAQSTGKWGFNQWQPVIVYGTDPYLKRGMGRRPDVVVTNAGNTGNPFDHPCPKPAPSWQRILLRVSPSEADLILDPFMGSGTTLEVAKYTGRRAIGADTSERYCEIAANRLAQGVLDFGTPA